MRKRWGIMLAGVLAVTSLTACGNKAVVSEESVATSEEVTPTQTQDATEVAESAPSEANHEYVEDPIENFNFTILDDETVGITKYLGSTPYLIVPETIHGRKVVDIAGFVDHDELIGVKLPKTTKIIRDRSFNDCSNLESIYLGESVEVIEEAAFINCDKLAECNFPDTITEMGEMAFDGSHLTDIHIPTGLTEISSGAFCNNNAEEFYIPGNIKKIGSQGFAGSPDLKKVVIEDGVESIGYAAFEDAEQLEELHIPASVTEFGDDYIVDYSEILTIYAPAGSAAESYASDNGLKFVAE